MKSALRIPEQVCAPILLVHFRLVGRSERKTCEKKRIVEVDDQRRPDIGQARIGQEHGPEHDDDV